MKLQSLFAQSLTKVSPIEFPYIIAEIGVNHEGKLSLAKDLIDLAAEGGADAVKFQTYRASTLASENSPAYWDLTKEPTRSQRELFKKYDHFWKEEMSILRSHSQSVGVEFLSTPFDFESAAFLSEMVPAFKLSSSDITNKPFIRHVAGFRLPIILSTGASHLHEIQEAVGWIDSARVPLALLHCVLNYPTSDSNANLGRIDGLRRAFPDRLIGYSDHTLPGEMDVCTLAVAIGAKIIEKHFTHDKSLPGNDHYHAMNKQDLIRFRSNLVRLFELVGSFEVMAHSFEAPAIANARRSIVAARTITAGSRLSLADLTFKRPAHGISPKHIEEVVGKTTCCEIAEDTIIQWRMLA